MRSIFYLYNYLTFVYGSFQYEGRRYNNNINNNWKLHSTLKQVYQKPIMANNGKYSTQKTSHKRQLPNKQENQAYSTMINSKKKIPTVNINSRYSTRSNSSPNQQRLQKLLDQRNNNNNNNNIDTSSDIIERSYVTKKREIKEDADESTSFKISNIGYSLIPLHREQVLVLAKDLSYRSRVVLLPALTVTIEGSSLTSSSPIYETQNGFDIRHVVLGSDSSSSNNRGIFCCAIGDLPLFTTDSCLSFDSDDGYLFFANPVSNDHVLLIPHSSSEQRNSSSSNRENHNNMKEVFCARSRCHLGYYDEEHGWYMVSASALKYFPSRDISYDKDDDTTSSLSSSLIPPLSGGCYPISSLVLEAQQNPFIQILQEFNRLFVVAEELYLGDGGYSSLDNIEYALRKLPGIVATETGHFGEYDPDQVSIKNTDCTTHVVRVLFDPNVLSVSFLLGCFMNLLMYSQETKDDRQSRICYIFVRNANDQRHIRSILDHWMNKNCGYGITTAMSVDVQVPVDRLKFWRDEDMNQHSKKLQQQYNISSESSIVLSYDEWIDRFVHTNEIDG